LAGRSRFLQNLCAASIFPASPILLPLCGGNPDRRDGQIDLVASCSQANNDGRAIKKELDNDLNNSLLEMQLTTSEFEAGVICEVSRACDVADSAWSSKSGMRVSGEEFMGEIERVIHAFILHEFLPGEDADELKEGTRLITGGILDSISTLKLVTFLEDQFGIRIEAYEAGVEHLDTIRLIAELVVAKRSAA
jgi:acyl carrier protein